MFHALCLKYVLIYGLFLTLAENASIPPTQAFLPLGTESTLLCAVIPDDGQGPSVEFLLLYLQIKWFRISCC